MRYTLTLRRVTYGYVDIAIDAASYAEAKAAVLDMAEDQTYTTYDTEYHAERGMPAANTLTNPMGLKEIL